MTGPQQGPPPPIRPYTHDMKYFEPIMARLQEWRSEDHADSIVLSRHEVIEIIEGVKQLRRERGA